MTTIAVPRPVSVGYALGALAGAVAISALPGITYPPLLITAVVFAILAFIANSRTAAHNAYVAPWPATSRKARRITKRHETLATRWNITLTTSIMTTVIFGVSAALKAVLAAS